MRFISKKTIFFFAVLFIFIAVYVAFAWTEPATAPPAGNAPAPVNTSPTAQTKTGGLNIMGNVGIGTTTPDIVGWGGSNRVLTIKGASTNSVIELVSGEADGWGADIGAIDFVFPPNTLNKEVSLIWSETEGPTANNRGGYLSFWTKPDAGSIAERMRITGSGNIWLAPISGSVGIGTVAPLVKLAVGTPGGTTTARNLGSVTIDDSAKLNSSNVWMEFADSTGVANARTYGFVRSGGAGGNFSIFDLTSGVDLARMTFNKDGNVGIGTTAPVVPLQVVGAIQGSGLIRSTGGTPTGTTGAGVELQQGAGFGLVDAYDRTIGAYQPLHLDGSTLTFKVSDVAKMTIDASGNVGIGTTSPQQELEVNGGVRLNTTAAKPACNATTRGTLWFTQGATDDALEVCMLVSSSYIWKNLVN